MCINIATDCKRSDIKILLVIPKTPYRWGGNWPLPPIGTTYVSSSLKAAGYSVSTINLNMGGESTFSVLERVISAENIDVIGCGGLVLNHAVVKEVIQLAKLIKPEIFAFIGGSLVTNSAQEAMEIVSDADVGIIGEGEITAVELMDALLMNIELESIQGLILKTVNGFIQTPRRKELVDIDRMPWPDYDGFRFHELAEKLSITSGNKSIAVTSSRACPFHCTFCSKSGGEKYRQRSLDSLFEEINYLVSEHHYTQLFFNDELFAHNEERIVEFCKHIEPLHVEWLVFLRVNKYLTVEMLRRMKQCGCIQIFYGIESADDRILRSMKKGITLDEINSTLNNTALAEIQASGSIILGDTAETMETIGNSIRWLEENKNNAWLDLSIAPIKLYPGSELYALALRKGLIIDSTAFILQDCPLVNVSRLTMEEYQSLVDVKIPQVEMSLRNGKNGCTLENVRLEVAEAQGKYVLYHICDKCKEPNKVEISSGGIFYLSGFVCENCGKTYATYIRNLYFEQIEPILAQLLDTNRVAIWGCGAVFQMIYEASSSLKKSFYKIVDSNSALQEKLVYGRQVYPPAKLLEEKDIDHIIIMSTSSSEISQIVKNEYKSIANTVGIFELGFYVENLKNKLADH